MPAVTVDCVIVADNSAVKSVLLIRRKRDPFKDCWALPGGFVDINEDLHDAACRELKEETGLAVNGLRQLFTVGTPGRDPRGRTISVIYGAITSKKLPPLAGDDAASAAWFCCDTLPPLAFDHQKVLEQALSMMGQW